MFNFSPNKGLAAASNDRGTVKSAVHSITKR